MDDEESIRFGLSRLLEQRGASTAAASSLAEALPELDRARPDVVLLDLKLPDADALSGLARIRSARPEARVVMMTAYGTIETAVAAIRSGAEDFLTKPIATDHLLHVVGRLASALRLEAENRAFRREMERASAELAWGESEAILGLLEEARQVARSESLVVLSGESGTGKGALARQIHAWSPRSEAPFVNVNCAGLSRDLLESELFGHEKGAFTGASGAKPGLFELADLGTLFLDEVAEIDRSLQPKLLKAIEEKKFHRVGGIVERSVNPRVIAATNRNLREEVAAGRFRQDLFFRINVLELRLPPLRERPADVAPLARRFLAELDLRAGRGDHRLDERGERVLAAYSWPGNVRELRNLMERASILAPPGAVADEFLARHLGISAPGRPQHMATLEEREKEYIGEVLRATAGNKTAAAEILGITRNTLYAKIRSYGLSEEA